MNGKIVLSILVLTALAGCKQATTDTTTAAATPAAKPVATVNGTALNRDLYEFIAKNMAGKAASDLTVAERNELLDSLVRAEVMAQQAEKDGLNKSDDNTSRMAVARMQLLQQSLQANFLKGKTATEAETKAEYDAYVTQLPKFQYHAHHILVPTEAEAAAAIARIKKGEKFDAVAKALSKDSSNAGNGGDLGFFNVESMDPAFGAAVVALDKGAMSAAPVKSSFGYHVIRLDDKRPNVAAPYDSIKTQLEQRVLAKKWASYGDDLVKSAKIEKTL
jgi:peptidyl-prolyl cis-trans isomerase C